jgi:hypothetical protein
VKEGSCPKTSRGASRFASSQAQFSEWRVYRSSPCIINALGHLSYEPITLQKIPYPGRAKTVIFSATAGRCSVLSSNFVRVLCALVLLLILPAYPQSVFPDYPARPVSDYAVSAQAAGFTIGMEALDDVQKQRTYFHTALPKKGFVPVFVVIQNGSNGDSFLFDKTKVRYGPADARVSTPKEGSKAGQSLALAAIPFVGIFGAMRVISNASEVQQNFLKKEIQSTTLSSGASASGFLYIPVPKNTPRQKIRLRVPISKAGLEETFTLDLVL